MTCSAAHHHLQIGCFGFTFEECSCCPSSYPVTGSVNYVQWFHSGCVPFLCQNALGHCRAVVGSNKIQLIRYCTSVDCSGICSVHDYLF